MNMIILGIVGENGGREKHFNENITWLVDKKEEMLNLVKY